MTIVRSYVFVHLPKGPVPAGLLTVADEPRNQFATFAYGRRYLERPDRIPVDPVAAPLHDAGTSRTDLPAQRKGLLSSAASATPLPMSRASVSYVQGYWAAVSAA